MADNQDIVYNVTGQTLYLDVPEGRPSSVTSVSVLDWDAGDDDTAESATTGSASIDDVNTTVDAASGRAQSNPRLLYVASTTSVEVGRQYLVTGSQSEKEWFEVLEIASGDYLVTRLPLANDYASTNTVQGTRISISVDSTWIADDANISDRLDPNPGYRVRWVYVVGGVTYTRYTYFDVVRSKGQHNVRPIDIERLVPGYIDNMARHHRADNGRALIDEAYVQVSLDLHESGIPDQQVRHQDVIDDLVKRKTVVLWAEARTMTSGGDPVAVEVALRSYQRRFESLIATPSMAKVTVGTETTGAGNVRSAIPLTVR